MGKKIDDWMADSKRPFTAFVEQEPAHFKINKKI